jgi:phage shock protein E
MVADVAKKPFQRQLPEERRLKLKLESACVKKIRFRDYRLLSRVNMADPPSTLYLDVRRPEEVAAPPALPGHLRSMNIPCTAADASALRSAELPDDKAAPILVFCKAGSRAAKALEVLIELGYSNVVNGGGITDVLRQLGDAK